MDEYYSTPVNSDPKSGLALTASDMDTSQFPIFCEELDLEQSLTLDDPQSFYLAFPGSDILGICDETFSRASSAVTPQSDCSTRTTSLSTSNISPTSDILSFKDKPNSQDIEAMYHDTTQSIISGRQSRATSVTWPPANIPSVGFNGALTPSRPTPHRPQSFSYRTPQISQQNARNTPPPPSSFFPSPSLQSQTSTSQSPYLSPNLHSPHIPQMTSLPTQPNRLHATMVTNPPSYFTHTQSQPPPPQRLQQLQQHFQQSSDIAFQQQLQYQLQQQLHAQQQSHTISNQANPFAFFTNQIHSQEGFPNVSNSTTPIPTPSLSDSVSTPNSNNTINNTNNPATLPNTTGNSSTGYQCFSHGCGGRHFSNWGNLVRHHRERQLRSKAGAKPTCPRCGKGFTRSSARDAHVAGLKCVLGRRRRANGTNSSSGSGALVNAAADPTGDPQQQSVDTNNHGQDQRRKGSSGGNGNGNGPNADDESYDDGDNDNESGSLGSGGEELDEHDECEHEHERTQDIEILGRGQGVGGGGVLNFVASPTTDTDTDTTQMQRDHEMDALGLGLGFGLGAAHEGHVYLAPQQLQFQ